jgi:hypothetical protein
MTTRKLIKTDGTETDLPEPINMDQILALISARTPCTVNLRSMGHPLHVMVLDDDGWETELVNQGPDENGVRHLGLRSVRAKKPVNAKATELYHQQCRPGTSHQIVGDVVIVPDEDFA